MKTFLFIIAILWASLVVVHASDYVVQQQTIVQPVVVPYIWHVNPASEVFRTYRGMTQSAAHAATVRPVSGSPAAYADVLRQRCAACHTEDVKVEGDLILFDKSKQLLPHLPYELIGKRVSSDDPGTVMPPSGSLGDSERQAVLSWIEKKKGVVR